MADPVEQPDTAEYRDYADLLSGSAPDAIRALCDALDAARAELKVVKDFKDYMLAHDPGPFVTELEERAEAAESRSANALAALYARAEAAEAERDDFKQDSLAHLTMWQNKHAALQSAEARIAELYFLRVQVSDAHHHAVLRAEAAEAELARVAEDYAGLIVRCKATEARIAAALAILHDCHVTAEDMNRVRRALAGDVG